MPKWVIYGLVAAGDVALAVLFFSRGRVVVPAILLLAAGCFVVAAVKAARAKAPA